MTIDEHTQLPSRPMTEEQRQLQDYVQCQANYIDRLFQQAKRNMPELTHTRFTMQYFVENSPLSWAQHFRNYWNGETHLCKNWDWNGSPEYKPHHAHLTHTVLVEERFN